jgi:hypothetical protein
MERSVMTTSDWIAAIGLVIQLLLFGGLAWYCVETRRIRISATAQIEALAYTLPNFFRYAKGGHGICA